MAGTGRARPHARCSGGAAGDGAQVGLTRGSAAAWRDARRVSRPTTGDEEGADSLIALLQPYAPPPAAAAEAATALRAALAANEALQARLRDGLRELDDLLASSASLAARVEAAPAPQPPAPAGSIPAASPTPTRHAGPFRTANAAGVDVSRFWRARGRAPAPNADALRLAPAFGLAPHAFARPAWGDADDAALAAAVVAAARSAWFAELVRGPGAAGEAAADDFDAAGGDGARVAPPAPRLSLAAASAAAAALAPDSPEIRAAVAALTPTDWARLVASTLPGRSPADAAARWAQTLAPAVNSGPWSPAEDAALRAAVARHGESDWDAVAAAIGGGRRTPFAAFARWRRSLDPGATPSAWTPADDAALAAAVAAHGASAWTDVAAALGGVRTAKQCAHRWRANVGVAGRKAGPWTPADDATLREALAVEGETWAAVARRVPGRNEVQARARARVLQTADRASSRPRRPGAKDGHTLGRGDVGALRAAVAREQAATTAAGRARLRWDRVAADLAWPGWPGDDLRRAFEKKGGRRAAAQRGRGRGRGRGHGGGAGADGDV